MFAALIPMLAGMFGAITASIVGRVLMALFIGFVTYQGMTTTTDWIFAQMHSSLIAMPADIANFLGYMWVDKAVSTLISAYSAAMLVKMAGGTSITKTFIKKN